MLRERTTGRCGLIRVTKPRCGIIKIHLRIKLRPNGIRVTELRDREDREPGSTYVQKDLTERFSWSKFFEELHKHQKGEKKGKYEKFHEVRRKAEKDDEASATAMPDDFQLMAIVAGGGEFEHNQLAYMPFPSMMPLVRVVMSVDTSTSTSTTATAGTSERLRVVGKNHRYALLTEYISIGGSAGNSYRQLSDHRYALPTMQFHQKQIKNLALNDHSTSSTLRKLWSVDPLERWHNTAERLARSILCQTSHHTLWWEGRLVENQEGLETKVGLWADLVSALGSVAWFYVIGECGGYGTERSPCP
ncbi:hypothetical protein M9H77_16682 [Catharanthus roseus]|uniref:Uncharacterized protein n=1 Tax=Catharanthus roseus TaxID=4058 RepID=A0ACC0B2F9_CATRO|nr:hypothetical protein M9H77_16682 [Catharanthus roseus]